MPESPIGLDLEFKGERKYVQAGDFVDSIDRRMASDGTRGFLARMTFQRFARHGCELWCGEAPPEANVVARGVWNAEDASPVPLAIAETNEEISTRRPYDEALITRPARIDEHRITAPNRNPYSAIENVIALTKALNYALTPDVDGKWVVGRVDFRGRLFDSWREMTIECVSITAGMFSRNRILLDARDMGEIRFIVGRP